MIPEIITVETTITIPIVASYDVPGIIITIPTIKHMLSIMPSNAIGNNFMNSASDTLDPDVEADFWLNWAHASRLCQVDGLA